jgi:hypothetical protein
MYESLPNVALPGGMASQHSQSHNSRLFGIVLSIYDALEM